MPNCVRVQVLQLKNNDPDKFDWYNFLGHCYHLGDIRVNEDVLNKDVIIYDFKNVTAKHITKMTPIGLKKSALVLEVRLVRIKIFSPKYRSVDNTIQNVIRCKATVPISLHQFQVFAYNVLIKHLQQYKSGLGKGAIIRNETYTQ